jgi:hypothetical protein
VAPSSWEGGNCGVHQQGSPGAWTGLGQHLRGQHPQREPGIDDFARQVLRREPAALDDRVEANLLGVADALVELGEELAVVEIRGVNDVAGSAEFIGEREASRRESLRVVEHKLSHADPA